MFLSTEAKKRREAAEAFEQAGRTEMAAKERDEAEVIADYLPEPLTEQEVADLVTSAIAQLGVAGEGMRAMGKVMGVIQSKVKGRADGAAVAAEVRRQRADGPRLGSASPATSAGVVATARSRGCPRRCRPRRYRHLHR